MAGKTNPSSDQLNKRRRLEPPASSRDIGREYATSAGDAGGMENVLAHPQAFGGERSTTLAQSAFAPEARAGSSRETDHASGGDGTGKRPLQVERNKQQQAVHFDLAGRDSFLYKPLRQFKSPDGGVFLTANVTRLAKLMNISESTLRHQYNGWKELKGAELRPPEEIPPENRYFEPLYVLQCGEERLCFTDTLSTFAHKRKLHQSDLTALWNYGGTHRGWRRPAAQELQRMEAEGIVLAPRKYVPQQAGVFEMDPAFATTAL